MGHHVSSFFRSITGRKHTERDHGAVAGPEVEFGDMESSSTCRAQRSLDKCLPPVSNNSMDAGGEPKAFEDEADRAQFIRAAMIVMSDNGKYEILNSHIELMYTGRRDQWRASLAIVLTIDSFGRSIGSNSTETTRAKAFHRLKVDVLAMLDIILYNRDPNRRRELKAAALRELNAAPPKKAIEAHPPPPGFENLPDEKAPWRNMGPKAVRLKKGMAEIKERLNKMDGTPPEGNKVDNRGRPRPNSVQQRYLAKKGIFPCEIDGLGGVWDFGIAEVKREHLIPSLEDYYDYYGRRIAAVEDDDYCDPMDMEPTNVVERVARWQYIKSMREAEAVARTTHFRPSPKSTNALARHGQRGQNVENERVPTPAPPQSYRTPGTQAGQYQGPFIRDGRILPPQRQQARHGPVLEPEEETLNQAARRIAMENAKARDSAAFAKAEKLRKEKASKPELHETAPEEKQTMFGLGRQSFRIRPKKSVRFAADVTNENEGPQDGPSSSAARASGKPSSAPALQKTTSPPPPPRAQPTSILIQEPSKFQVFVTGSDGEEYPLDEDSPSTETHTSNRPMSAPTLSKKPTSPQIRRPSSSMHSQEPTKSPAWAMDSEEEKGSASSSAACRFNEPSSSGPSTLSPALHQEPSGPSLNSSTHHLNSHPASPQSAPIPSARSRMRVLQRTKSALKTAKSGKAAKKSVSFSSVRMIKNPGEEPVEELDHWDERDWQGDDDVDDEEDDVEDEVQHVDESNVEHNVDGHKHDDYSHGKDTDDNPKQDNDEPNEIKHENSTHDVDEFEDENDDVPLAVLFPNANRFRVPGAWPRSPSSVSSF